MPLVTACVPTTGRVAFLERALRGLRAQTYTNIETLVLDNASPPEAQALLRDVACWPATRVLRVEERVPMFANFNRGIRAAQGRYITFFHDDDEYQPDFLTSLVELLEAHPSTVFGGGNYDVIDGDGAVLRRNRLIPSTGVWPGRRFIEEILKRGRAPFSTPGIVFRASALAAGGFDESIPVNWGDFTILMRMAERGDVAVLADVHYAWRVHGGNASQIPSAESIPIRTGVLRAYCDEFAARNSNEPGTTAKFRRYVDGTHTKGLLWGWLSATDDSDARECRRLLANTVGGRALGLALVTLERVGLSLPRRRAFLPAIRKLANGLIAWSRSFARRGAGSH